MSYEAFMKLKSILYDNLKRDERKSRPEAFVFVKTIIGRASGALLAV